MTWAKGTSGSQKHQGQMCVRTLAFKTANASDPQTNKTPRGHIESGTEPRPKKGLEGGSVGWVKRCKMEKLVLAHHVSQWGGSAC